MAVAGFDFRNLYASIMLTHLPLALGSKPWRQRQTSSERRLRNAAGWPQAPPLSRLIKSTGCGWLSTGRKWPQPKTLLRRTARPPQSVIGRAGTMATVAARARKISLGLAGQASLWRSQLG